MPLQYWKTINPKTALEAVNGSGCSMAKLRKDEGETVAKAFLTVIVTDLIESFNVGKTMNDMQVVFAVNGILADYYYLKAEELKFIFEEAKKGRYGTMYDRIDAAVIFGWLDQFMIVRTNIWIQKNEEMNKAHKLEKIPLAANVLEALKENKKIMEPEPIPDMKLIEPEKRKLTEHEILIQDIMKEFDELHREKPYDSKETFRSIPYLGKNITQDEFLQIRLEELKKL